MQVNLLSSSSSSSAGPSSAQLPLPEVLHFFAQLMPEKESAYIIKAKRVGVQIHFDVLKERNVTLFTATRMPHYQGRLKLVIDSIGFRDADFASLGTYAASRDEITDIHLLQYCPSFRGFTAFLKNFPNLASIDLSAYQMGDMMMMLEEARLLEGFSELAKVCPNITTINLKDQTSVTDTLIQKIASYFPKLRSINLSRCDEISDAAVKALAEKCAISSIHLLGCRKITDDSIIALAEKGVLALADLSQCDITDASISRIQENCPDLTSIGLLECEAISQKQVKNLAKGCRKLTSITLDSCTKVGDKALQVLGTYCKELSSISLSSHASVTDMGIKAIVGPNITSIDLALCRRITDLSIKVIALFCPNLTHLSLVWLNEVTDESLIEVGKKCNKLRSVSLSLFKITDDSLLEIAKNCLGIQKVYLSYNNYITDRSIRALVLQNQDSLQEIELLRCGKITDAVLPVIGRHCPKLVFFDVTFCPQITNVAFDALKVQLPETRMTFSSIHQEWGT